jgi:glycosyltransferase involved in cell wall biosynthesis
VLFVSTSYPANLEDWRGLFIRHLSDALARRDDLGLHIWAPPGEMHPAILPFATASESAFLAELMHRGGIAHLLRAGGMSSFLATLRLVAGLFRAYRRAGMLDLYHVNWLQNALPVPANGRPLLVTVLGTDMQLLRKFGMETLLHRVFKQHPTVICPNADWMVAPLTAAFSDVAEIRFVPFGIDPMWYEVKRDKLSARPRWLAVTRLTRAKLGPLLQWAEPLFDGVERELHLFGPMQDEIALPAWVRYHGPASPESLCRQWFPTAQGLVTLSQHAEGRPQVMLEALAAGLPVVASRQPAHEDMLSHGETGWLCDSGGDVEQGLLHFENCSANRRAGEAGRAWAKREIGTWDDCAARYACLYRHLLDGCGHD